MSSNNDIDISENINIKTPTILNTVEEIQKYNKINKNMISIPVSNSKIHNTYSKVKKFHTYRTNNLIDKKMNDTNRNKKIKSNQNLEINKIINNNKNQIINIINEEKNLTEGEKLVPFDLNLLILNEDKKVYKEIELFFKKYNIVYKKKNNDKNFVYTCTKKNGIKFEVHLITLKGNAIFFKILKINGENNFYIDISKNMNNYFISH